ncbi:hypothetical protein [Streptomyces sp. NPDC002386]
MRRSTLITRALGGAALACAAEALSLVFLRYDAPAPRWDILSALGAALVTAGGWALAGRAAPRLDPDVPSAPRQVPSAPGVPPPPRRLPLPARQAGRTTGAVLLLLTPLVLTRLAAGSGGVLSGVVIVLASWSVREEHDPSIA